jgi:hypothetical protein
MSLVMNTIKTANIRLLNFFLVFSIQKNAKDRSSAQILLVRKFLYDSQFVCSFEYFI